MTFKSVSRLRALRVQADAGDSRRRKFIPLFLFSIAIVAPVGFVISIRLLEFSCLLTLPPLRASSVRALGLRGLALRGLASRGLALRGLASPRLFEITQFFEKLVLF